MSNTFVTREILRVDVKIKRWYEMLLPTLKLCTEVDETERDKHTEKYSRTWCIKWIFYYCISHITSTFMNTPKISAIAVNKGKHRFQKTLPHVGFLCAIHKALTICSNQASWNCQKRFSGGDKLGSLLKEGALKAPTKLLPFEKVNFEAW